MVILTAKAPNGRNTSRLNVLTTEVPVEPVEAAEHEEVLERFLLELVAQT